jgi:hypothetical protein
VLRQVETIGIRPIGRVDGLQVLSARQ